MSEEDRCNTTLGLGIFEVEVKREKQLKENKRGLWLDLSLPLHPKINGSTDHDRKYDEERSDQDSFSSKTVDDQDKEEKRVMKRSVSSNVDYYHSNDGSRKKLKLTTEQITLLEDSFKIHSTLNTGQKQELAKKLHLLPRQIEVWFQNRRARTKLKQIEQECALLRKCCETLRDENRKLQKELQVQDGHYCSLKFDNHRSLHPFYIRYPTTTEICHPCDKNGKPEEGMKTEVAMNGNNVVHEHDNCNEEDIVIG